MISFYPSQSKHDFDSTSHTLEFNLDVRDYFRWIFEDTQHPILVCVYPRGAGKTYASLDWVLFRLLLCGVNNTEEAEDNGNSKVQMFPSATILTKNIDLVKDRISSILKTKYEKLCQQNIIRMDKRNGQVDIYLQPKSKFPTCSIHTASYFQDKGGLGKHDKFIVCDEAADMPRYLWDTVLRQIAIQDIDKGGQFLLVGTPRGMDNVFYELYEQGQDENNKLVKSVKKTCYELNYPSQTIEFYKNTGTETAFRSELLCDFAVSSFYGSIYAPTIEQSERDGLISDDFTWNPKYPVNIAFDLGYNDATVCWFWQFYSGRIIFIDYLEVRHKYFRDILREDIKPKYQGNFNYCILPHDATSHHHSGGAKVEKQINSFSSLETEDTSFGVAKAMGWNVYRLPKISKLNATTLAPVRSFLRYCCFNATKCKQGLDNLKLYSFKAIYAPSLNSENKYVCTDIPEQHGDHLHACDAFRYVAYSKDIWCGENNNNLQNHRNSPSTWNTLSLY